MRTISFENVRFELNDIRAAIKDAKFNAVMFFCNLANMQFYYLKWHV